MVDGLLQNRTKKAFANVLSRVGGTCGREMGDNLTNVQYKPIWNCHNESLVQQIYPNKISLNLLNLINL
jgi:hypothetical protein